MNRGTSLAIATLTVIVAGCAPGAQPGATHATTAASAPTPAAMPASVTEKWTRAKVTSLFLDAPAAGLDGGELRIEPEGTAASIHVCVPLNPFDTPTVPVDKRYSTAAHEIRVPGKGHITQRGWVLPTPAAARTIMNKIAKKLPACRYHGNATVHLEPGKRIAATSTTHRHPPDHAWRGHRIEQVTFTNGKRASVGTDLLLRRGPVILRLTYLNHTPKTNEATLRTYNATVLRKVLARSA
jgi:hypothetical protein